MVRQNNNPTLPVIWGAYRALAIAIIREALNDLRYPRRRQDCLHFLQGPSGQLYADSVGIRNLSVMIKEYTATGKKAPKIEMRSKRNGSRD